MSKSGLKGEKRINYTSISSIECRKATTMAAGFLQFSIMGAGIGGGWKEAILQGVGISRPNKDPSWV